MWVKYDVNSPFALPNEAATAVYSYNPISA